MSDSGAFCFRNSKTSSERMGVSLGQVKTWNKSASIGLVNTEQTSDTDEDGEA